MIDPIQPEYDEKIERDLTPEELVAALLRTIDLNVNPWAQSSSVERVANDYLRQMIYGIDRRLLYDWGHFDISPGDVVYLGTDVGKSDAQVVAEILTIAGIEFTKYPEPIPPVNPPALPERTDHADENEES